jgi:bacterioferritin (cytochrome b1)
LVVTEPAEADERSRRWLLGAACAGAGGMAAILLAACGGSHHLSAETTTTPPVHSRDVELLNHLLDLEHIGIAAYTAGIPLLSPAGRMGGQQFLTQELSHAGELAGLVSQAGGLPNESKPSYDLGHPRTGDDVLSLLHEIERSQISAYLQAIPKLAMPSTRAALAAVLANDAQHIAVLRAELGRQAVPAALVNGHE